MIELCEFQQEDFERFKSWIQSKDALFQFAGPIFSYPVTDLQLINYVNDARRIPLKVVLADTGEVIGHCELNFENPLPKLSRILIANKDNRSLGLGQQLVNKMLEKLFIEYDFEAADLNVFDWNIGAIKCYEKVGFVINEKIKNIQNNGGVEWVALNMIISKEAWLKNRILK